MDRTEKSRGISTVNVRFVAVVASSLETMIVRTRSWPILTGSVAAELMTLTPFPTRQTSGE